MPTTKITATQIRAAMQKRWAAPEWAIMWEVGEATGAMAGRYADAVMMSLWPSRGLELHGVEIKVSRSDWRREAADPSKAEAVAKFCDRWWIHTPPGVVDDLSALPPAWGLREFDGKTWSTIREASITTAHEITRPFLASLLRRADKTMQSMIQEAMQEAYRITEDRDRERREQFAEQVQASVERRTAEIRAQMKDITEFEEAFGKSSPYNWTNPAAWGLAARALSECGPKGFGPLADRLRAAAKEIDALEKIVQGSALTDEVTQ